MPSVFLSLGESSVGELSVNSNRGRGPNSSFVDDVFSPVLIGVAPSAASKLFDVASESIDCVDVTDSCFC